MSLTFVFIQSASRSPPGQISNSEGQCKSPQWIHFQGHFWSHFLHFWDHYWSNFRLLGALWGRCGLIFSVKNGLGHQKCPKSRQSEIPGISPHPFGDLLELCFRTFSYFFVKNSGSEICPFFSSIVGSPWALHGMGSYAIRPRRRSPNTLFQFYTFSEK